MLRTVFTFLLFVLPLPLFAACNAAMTLDISRPEASEAEPTVVYAKATSGCPVTTMRVYVDYKLVYEQHGQDTINARLVMGLGVHRVGIQAWNSAGTLAKDERFITSYGDGVEPLFGCEIGGVDGAVYSGEHVPSDSRSPVWMGMLGHASAPITSMRLYIDGVDRAPTWNTSGWCLPVALMSLKPGYRFVTIEAWDSQGNVYLTGSILHVVP